MGHIILWIQNLLSYSGSGDDSTEFPGLRKTTQWLCWHILTMSHRGYLQIILTMSFFWVEIPQNFRPDLDPINQWQCWLGLTMSYGGSSGEKPSHRRWLLIVICHVSRNRHICLVWLSSGIRHLGWSWGNFIHLLCRKGRGGLLHKANWGFFLPNNEFLLKKWDQRNCLATMSTGSSKRKLEGFDWCFFFFNIIRY